MLDLLYVSSIHMYGSLLRQKKTTSVIFKMRFESEIVFLSLTNKAAERFGVD